MYDSWHILVDKPKQNHRKPEARGETTRVKPALTINHIKVESVDLPMTSTPFSWGASQATWMVPQVVATTPRLEGGVGGLAVFRVRWSDWAVRMNVLLKPSSRTASPSGGQYGVDEFIEYRRQ